MIPYKIAKEYLIDTIRLKLINKLGFNLCPVCYHTKTKLISTINELHYTVYERICLKCSKKYVVIRDNKISSVTNYD